MTIRYSNGYQIEGVILTSNENSMRVALQGSNDVLQLNDFHGTWVTEDCEPVHVELEWAKREEPVVTLDDCLCSKELAAKLLHLLFSGEQVAESEIVSLSAPVGAPVYQQIV